MLFILTLMTLALAPLYKSKAATRTITVYASADTYLSELNPNTVCGSEELIVVGQYGAKRRILLYFDLSSIPVMAQVKQPHSILQ